MGLSLGLIWKQQLVQNVVERLLTAVWPLPRKPTTMSASEQQLRTSFSFLAKSPSSAMHCWSQKVVMWGGWIFLQNIHASFTYTPLSGCRYYNCLVCSLILPRFLLEISVIIHHQFKCYTGHCEKQAIFSQKARTMKERPEMVYKLEVMKKC